MNERAAVSVQSIKQNILAEPPEGLLYFAIFGSQVRGTERPDSDLDIVYVTRTNPWGLYIPLRNTVLGVSGGVEKITVLPHTLGTIQKVANLYGSVEYNVLRGESKVLYTVESFNVKLEPNVDYTQCAQQWLDIARDSIFEKEPRLLTGLNCFLMAKSIYYILRANIISMGVKFPLTRDVRVLYDMLPPERRPPLDLDTLDNYLSYTKNRVEHVTRVDLDTAVSMAERAYNFTRTIIKGN